MPPKNPVLIHQPERKTTDQTAMCYRDYCNTCGAELDTPHEARCHLDGLVGRWSGIVFAEDRSDR